MKNKKTKRKIQKKKKREKNKRKRNEKNVQSIFLVTLSKIEFQSTKLAETTEVLFAFSPLLVSSLIAQTRDFTKLSQVTAPGSSGVSRNRNKERKQTFQKTILI